MAMVPGKRFDSPAILRIGSSERHIYDPVIRTGVTDDLGDREAVKKHSEQANVQMVDKLFDERK